MRKYMNIEDLKYQQETTDLLVLFSSHGRYGGGLFLPIESNCEFLTSRGENPVVNDICSRSGFRHLHDRVTMRESVLGYN